MRIVGRLGWIAPAVVAASACGEDGASAAARADAKRAAGDLDGAIAEYTKTIAADPRDASAYVGRGRAKSSKRDFAGAVADFSAAVSLAPMDATPRYHRGVALAATGDHSGAIADFTAAIVRYARYAGAFAGRAASRRATGDLDGAVADASAALEIDPQSAAARLARAEARHDKGDLDGALADYSAAIERGPRDAEAWSGRGVAKYAKGDVQGALADLSKAVEIDPTSPYALANRGLAKKDAGDLDGAVADASAAVTFAPKDAAARIVRGDALQATGDLEGALAEYDVAVAGAKALDVARARGRRGRLRLEWLGASAEALADLRAGADGVAAERDYLRLWAWIARAGAGEEKAAGDELLAQAAARCAADVWFAKVAGFLAGRVSEKDLVAASASDDAARATERTCEATFYAGAVRALRGERAAAIGLFDRCIATGVRRFVEFDGAVAWRTTLLVGARIEPLSLPTRGALAVKDDAFAFVRVDPDGPAARAGLRVDDVVVRVDEKPTSPAAWRRRLCTAANGTLLKLSVIRDRKPLDVELKLGRRE